MATRVLPGVYVSLNDLSQLPEGAQSLTVGYVVKANRGPVNEFNLVTSPTDFLTKYTFNGVPAQTDDPTFHSVLKVLAKTNAVYIVRAANKPLYGGAIVKKAQEYGTITAVDQENETITIDGEATPSVGERITIAGTNVIDGYYVVKAVNGKVITVTGDIKFNETEVEIADFIKDSKVYRTPIVPISNQKIADVNSTVEAEHAIYLSGNVTNRFSIGDKITIKDAEISAYAENINGDYTVAKAATFDDVTGLTKVEVEENIKDGGSGAVYFNSIINPEAFKNFFTNDDLMLITGKDAGTYNGQEAFTILSSVDNSDQMVYYKGATGIFDTPCTFDTMQLDVINTNTNEILESFTFSRDPEAKTIDGSLLFVDDVVSGSAYIQIINNSATTDCPLSTLSGSGVQASGGSNGETVTSADMVAALTVFEDKTIPISILGNGCSKEAESVQFQTAMTALAANRKDILAVLSSPKEQENATLPSTRAQNIVKYKKDNLGTSFYGCMYAPHVKVADIYNSREVTIGSDAIAIAGWLDVITNLNYPYAYAGPRNGLVTGVTCDWKIGDKSGEAQILNDASINYVAFDGKVGRYYMQTQNTLQIANSVMRNIGAVLNVLDIKETLAIDLKEYLGLPITTDLRRDIVDSVNDYLSPMVGIRFYNYSFQDTSTDSDIANDTLRFLLTIAPTAYANRIYLVMNIVNATFDFSILQSA